MDLIPSRGLCHAVFLLNRAAHLRENHSENEWVERARRQSTIMASALNLERVAQTLVKVGLVRTAQCISPVPELDELWIDANSATFLAIARVLLEKCPPPWLEAAVSAHGLLLEYIPTTDLNAMRWLGEHLEDLLIEAGRKLQATTEDEFARRLGNAAELVVLRAKEREGGQTIHVARISDSFGYDIEHRVSSDTTRIEVKGAVESSSYGFFITRNEVVQARRYATEWVLMQVIFRSAIALRDELKFDDIIGVRTLTSDQVCSLVPPDTPHFSWTASARVRPPVDFWSPHALDLSETVSIQLTE
jgi:hypothetical protein